MIEVSAPLLWAAGTSLGEFAHRAPGADVALLSLMSSIGTSTHRTWIALAAAAMLAVGALGATACGSSAGEAASDAGAADKPLTVGASDTIVISYEFLGAQRCSGTWPAPDSIRLSFADGRATRSTEVCPIDAGVGGKGRDGGDGGDDAGSDAGGDGGRQFAVREATMTTAQRDAIRAALDKVTLVDGKGQCAGYDGTSYAITIERVGGAKELYTDGISNGCNVYAQGLLAVYKEAATIFP